jgi:hypothetical protein
MQQRRWQEVNFNQFSAYKMGDEPKALSMQNIIKSIRE